MKRSPYLPLAALGIALLGGATTIGFCESRWGRVQAQEQIAEGKVSQRQLLERRRGRVAEVAIAATTAQ